MTPYTHAFVAMTTACHLTLFAPHAAAARLCQAVETRVQALAHKYNYWAADSWLNRHVNRRRSQWLTLDEETVRVLAVVREHAVRCNGVFDICHGSIADLLRDARDADEVATLHARFTHAMGLDAWQLDSDRLLLPNPATRFDLGGVIKEYAVDVAAAMLRAAGVSSAIINFGGDLSVVGRKPDGSRFVAAVPNPRDPQQMLFALDLENQALTTSAHYARSRRLGEHTLSHVAAADPDATDALLSASVVAPSALVAGIYSTALLIRPQLTLPEDCLAVGVDSRLQLMPLP